MAALDFREIPITSAGSSDPDALEHFAHDLLELMGLAVVAGPDRGPDGGRDLVAAETRHGAIGNTTVRWLVSCKHYAHSGKAVGVADEQNVQDRCSAHQCSGFMGIYSTIPSSALTTRLSALTSIETLVLGRGKLEAILLERPDGLRLVARYMPKSYRAWQAQMAKRRPRARGPATLGWKGQQGLRCVRCGTDLLKPPNGNLVMLYSYPTDDHTAPRRYERVLWCCKKCDYGLTYSWRGPDRGDVWDDIPDLAIPDLYLRFYNTAMNELRAGGATYSDEAYRNLVTFLCELYPYVARDVRRAERTRMRELQGIPEWAGGLG